MKKIMMSLFILTASISGFTQDKEGAEDLVNDGIILHDRGDYAGAIKIYDKALLLDKNNYFAMAEKALTLYTMGSYAKAIEFCKEIVIIHSEEKELWNVYCNWGNSLDALGKSEESIEVYEEGIVHFPDSYLLYFNEGIAYTTLKKYDEALPLFQKAVMANPSHAGSHNAIGRLLYGENRIPSLMAFLRFFAIEPEGSRAVGNIELVRQMTTSNVSQKGNVTTITIDIFALHDTTEDGTVLPDDFATVDFMLSLNTALVYNKENKKKKEAERFAMLLDNLCLSLKAGQEKNSGFYWNYYVPYFIEMQEKEFTEVFSYLVFASSGEKYVKKWFEVNRGLTQQFFKWSDNYEWYKG